MNEMINWSQILNNNLISIHPQMLHENGLILQIKCQLKGQSPRNYLPELRYVQFDLEFVKFKLNKLLELINLEGDESDKIQLVKIVFEILNVAEHFNHNTKVSEPEQTLIELTYAELIAASLFSHRKLRAMKKEGDTAVDCNGSLWQRLEITTKNNQKPRVIYQKLGNQ